MIAVVAVYGYLIVLSLWAVRVQRVAAHLSHHPFEHPAMSHIVERSAHRYIASMLTVSLAVRLVQLIREVTPWLLVPMTILAALLTAQVLIAVWRMAVADIHNWYIDRLNKLKTVVLPTCTAGALADQVWRVVTLFWF